MTPISSTPQPDCTPAQAAFRWLRAHSPWLFLALFYPAYRLIRYLSEAGATADVPAADAAGTAAQLSAQWLNLAGPGSKMLVAAGVFSFALGFVWLSMTLLTPVLAHWARGHYKNDPENPATDFKATFLHLPHDQQIKLFCVVWLALLCFFSVCWLGAALVQ